MFAAHSLLVQDTMRKPLEAGEDSLAGMRLGPDLTVEEQKILDYYKKTLTFPAPPELCMDAPAVVVLEDVGFSGEEPVALSALTKVGQLEMIVTDVLEAFPRFAEQTGGRQVAALRVVGFAEDGVVVSGSRGREATRLVAHMDAERRRFVFAKSITGKWLVPQGSATRPLVLVAEAGAAPLLDVAEGSVALVAPAWEVTKEGTLKGLEATKGAVAPAWEVTKEGTLKGLEATSAAVAPAWEATKQNVAPVIVATGAAVAPAWEATKEGTRKGLNATSAAVEATRETYKEKVAPALGKTVEATGAAVAPAWEATKEGTRKGLEVTKGAVAPAWEVTKQNVAPVLESSGVTAAWETTVEVTRENTRKGLEAAAPVWDSTASAFNQGVQMSVESTQQMLAGVSASMKDLFAPPPAADAPIVT